MITCPSCGKELPGEFPFCPFCTAPLTKQAAAAVHEERKVVTVLFCDLVGFTAASETADPEDVRSRIRPYHARLREELEGYGGTVEKFIGDAVMAVFGAPVAHEDDAERAIRAGLRILEAISELNEQDPALSLQVRIGINTGEAVVALGARPEEGEGIVTGDVVNTASRLQGAAPVNGIAVSEQTYRATERVFEWEELATVQVKGKAEPLALFRPLAPRARFGSDVTRTHTTPLVGRELEKPLLIGTFERAMQQRSCQLVTIVGEPGVGKSRLCTELFQHLYGRPGLTRWRQGRCLPYGEGIAFWALGEIVKAECGILESDSPQEADAKLERALPADDPDRPWLKARLSPLVGARGEPASQEESFTAWRRCLEAWAEARETVLVFEDLHWADESLLAFLEHLAEWTEGVPLLVLCTARPELYERHSGFGANARNAQRINLPPLTDAETARLIASLLERAVLPAETQQTLLERAGGNPLYAEEFVRLLADRGGVGEATEVPDSVQALIAARLDTLSPERKSLLQDAAVIGKVFWAGALAEMGGREPREVEQALHELSRKELVRPSRTSSMEGESEYGFWHLLVRDVCYAQIPRAARAARHRSAAAWIEQKAGERLEDLADVLAHHYLTALELARAVGQTEETMELEAVTIRYLALAGDRALSLDVGAAEAYYKKALELAPTGHRERADALSRWANAVRQLGRQTDAAEALEEAIALSSERGDLPGAARSMVTLTQVLWSLGDARCWQIGPQAVAMLEAEGPSPDLVDAYSNLASGHYLSTRAREAVEYANKAISLAGQSGLDEPAKALGVRGGARCDLGDMAGLDDMRRALALAVERGRGRDAAVLYNNLGLRLWFVEGPAAYFAKLREGIEFAEARGITELVAIMTVGSMEPLFDLGSWQELLDSAERLADRLERSGETLQLVEVRGMQGRVLAAQGHATEALPGTEWAVQAARNSGSVDFRSGTFSGAAQVRLAAGQPEGALELLSELEQIPHANQSVAYTPFLPAMVRTAITAGDSDLAERLTIDVSPQSPYHEHVLCATGASIAETRGDIEKAAEGYAEAVERWREFGNVPECAHALLGQGRCLLAQAEAETPLRQARELFASMGYKAALAEAEALLGESEAAAV